MAVKITQCHGHMPLSGRRFGSFAGKAVAASTGDDSTQGGSLMQQQWVPQSWRKTHVGHWEPGAHSSSAWGFRRLAPSRTLSAGGLA